ncbi:flavodoxin family protein [Congregibacter sp.]|uniref:flavodoxin family protein n=1 Tax=Congregibacter sp. TaxID=2744308 RepID=UPI003F6BD9EE
MSQSVCVVYHSGYGHTQKQAEAVAEGVSSLGDIECHLLPVADLEADDAPAWGLLDACDAMIFGSPTYMGSASAPFKAFMEATSQRWMEQRWAMKLAAGFTNSGSQNGDKQNTLMQFITLAAQHGMLWVNLNQMPGNNSTAGSVDDMNRLGASLGAMAQSAVDAGPEVGPTKADLDTARAFGAHVATCAQRWNS